MLVPDHFSSGACQAHLARVRASQPQEKRHCFREVRALGSARSSLAISAAPIGCHCSGTNRNGLALPRDALRPSALLASGPSTFVLVSPPKSGSASMRTLGLQLLSKNGSKLSAAKTVDQLGPSSCTNFGDECRSFRLTTDFCARSPNPHLHLTLLNSSPLPTPANPPDHTLPLNPPTPSPMAQHPHRLVHSSSHAQPPLTHTHLPTY